MSCSSCRFKAAAAAAAAAVVPSETCMFAAFSPFADGCLAICDTACFTRHSGAGAAHASVVRVSLIALKKTFRFLLESQSHVGNLELF